MQNILEENYSEEFRRLNEKLDRIIENSDQSCENYDFLPEKWLDIQQACQALNVQKRTLQNYRNSGLLKFSKVGGKIYFKAIDIQKHLESHYGKSARK